MTASSNPLLRSHPHDSALNRRKTTVVGRHNQCLGGSSVSLRLSCLGFSSLRLSTLNVRLSSIHHALQRIQRFPRQRIPRLDLDRFLERFHRAPVHFFSKIRAAQ